MSSKLVTTINGQTIEANILHTTLSFEQVQVLCALAHGFSDHQDKLYLTVQDAILIIDGDEQLVWHSADDAISHSRTIERDDGASEICVNRYEVRRSRDCTGSYITVACGPEHPVGITATFKDGMLESHGDQPALILWGTGGYKVRSWFHRSICYRLANPELPAQITNYGSDSGSKCIASHRNIYGELHRKVTQGPAIYEINGETCWMARYYLNGAEVNYQGLTLGVVTTVTTIPVGRAPVQ